MKINGSLGLKNLNNNRGQMAIEAVLLMTVLLGGFLFITKYAREKQLLQNLFDTPIKRIGTMAGYGTWKEECAAVGKPAKQSLGKCHPNSIHRSLSSNPKL
ncbi:MAG: hypothetical protein H7061_01480 [Bdellovibrionaceae bacterium]|nr:hypothetical protein [Bdellovibrio sp.]